MTSEQKDTEKLSTDIDYKFEYFADEAKLKQVSGKVTDDEAYIDGSDSSIMVKNELSESDGKSVIPKDKNELTETEMKKNLENILMSETQNNRISDEPTVGTEVGAKDERTENNRTTEAEPTRFSFKNPLSYFQSEAPTKEKQETEDTVENISEKLQDERVRQTRFLEKIQNNQMYQKNAMFQKIELLRKFEELKSRGFVLSKNYNTSSSLEEMNYEYQLLRSMQDKKNSVKLYKNFMMNTVTAIEFLNERYDPFDFKLKGWSEHMSINSDDYDDVFGEIYEKYKGTGKKMEPEIKLLLMLLASAGTFHASNTIMKSLPGLEDVLKNNPNLMHSLSQHAGMNEKMNEKRNEAMNNQVRPEFNRFEENNFDNHNFARQNLNQKLDQGMAAKKMTGPSSSEFIARLRAKNNQRGSNNAMEVMRPRIAGNLSSDSSEIEYSDTMIKKKKRNNFMHVDTS